MKATYRLGLSELRAAVAAHFSAQTGVPINPADVDFEISESGFYVSGASVEVDLEGSAAIKG